MNELALFAGAGGGILGGKLLGWKTVCAVEWDGYACDVLLARQNDGCLEAFPIWDDVQTFDGRAWRGRVDVVSGGFPCQDISAAGKGAGIDGERSGMWGHMARIIGEVGPSFVFVENSPMLTSRGLGRVLGDLAAMGYDARWGVLGAVHAGAPHKRERIWIVANALRELRLEANSGVEREEPIGKESRDSCAPQFLADDSLDERRRVGDGGQDVANASGGRCGGPGAGQSEQPRGTETECRSEDVADPDRPGLKEQRCAVADGAEHEAAECGGWWESEPDVGRVANGISARVDRLRCLGNAQVPAVAALAWRILKP